jgi:hypothetical protein
MSSAVRLGGEFRLVLLQGEAGTGKTRLGRELLRRHREVTGLVAHRYPLAASAAFGLWTEAMDPFLQSLPDGEVVELCEGLLDDLASLFAASRSFGAPCPSGIRRSRGLATTPRSRSAPTGRAIRRRVVSSPRRGRRSSARDDAPSGPG